MTFDLTKINLVVRLTYSCLQCFLYCILGLSIFFIVTLSSNLPEVIKFPDELVYLPQFLVQWMFFIVYNLILTMRLVLTPNYTLSLTVHGLFGLLLIIELLYPYNDQFCPP